MSSDPDASALTSETPTQRNPSEPQDPEGDIELLELSNAEPKPERSATARARKPHTAFTAPDETSLHSEEGQEVTHQNGGPDMENAVTPSNLSVHVTRENSMATIVNEETRSVAETELAHQTPTKDSPEEPSQPDLMQIGRPICKLSLPSCGGKVHLMVNYLSGKRSKSHAALPSDRPSSAASTSSRRYIPNSQRGSPGSRPASGRSNCVSPGPPPPYPGPPRPDSAAAKEAWKDPETAEDRGQTPESRAEHGETQIPNETVCSKGFDRVEKCIYGTILPHSKMVVGFMVGFCLLALFIGLFTPSFTYLDYDKIALKWHKTSNYIDRKTTYYQGCYVLGPDIDFISFPSTAHNEVLDEITITTTEPVFLKITVAFQYFIRSEELGHLFGKFHDEYRDVFLKMALSGIKNVAVTYSIEDFRNRRRDIEIAFHKRVAENLGGNCCPRNCTSPLCAGCQPASTCSLGNHADVRYFQLLEVEIPPEVTTRYMRATIDQVFLEKDQFVQDYTVTKKLTEKQVEDRLNTANEILANATAFGSYITSMAHASADVVTQNATGTGWKDTCDSLGLTQQDHKLSLLYLHQLRHMTNVHADYDITSQIKQL